MARPVRLPPGRARLSTKPRRTGSGADPNTTGIVLVAALAAAVAIEPALTIRSTSRRASSAAAATMRSGVSAWRREVLPIDPAEVAQALPQGRLGLSSGGAGRFGREIADPSGPLGTAGHGAGEDPDSGQADDQIAPLHSISPGLSRAVNRANS